MYNHINDNETFGSVASSIVKPQDNLGKSNRLIMPFERKSYEKKFSPNRVSERWLDRPGNQEKNKRLKSYGSDDSKGSIIMNIEDSKFIIQEASRIDPE